MVSYGAGILPKISPSEFIRLVKDCESWGYDTVWVPDERFYREVYSFLSLCSQNTSIVKMGTCVTDPYTRHPAMTAMAIGTIDELSNGRAILGIGAGISGFAEMGLKRISPAVALKEAVLIIKQLLSGKPVNFEGKMFSLQNTKIEFQTCPDLPVYIAARGPKALEAAGEVSDGVIIGAFASKETLNYAFNNIQKGCIKGGKDFSRLKMVSWAHLCMSEDKRAAITKAKEVCIGVLLASKPIISLLGIDVPQTLSDFLSTKNYGLGKEELGKGIKMIPDEMVEHFTITGTPKDCVRKAQDLFSLGVHHIGVLPWQIGNKGIDETLEVFVKNALG